LTRDAVPIKSIDWRAECRIRAAAPGAPASGGDASRATGDRYQFDHFAVRQAAWVPGDLESALATEIACTLAESIRSIPMDQLLDPEGRLVPLGAALESARIVLSDTLGAWGMTLVALRVPSLELDDDVRVALSALWRTKTEARAAALTTSADPLPAAPLQRQAEASPPTSRAGPDTAAASQRIPTAGRTRARASPADTAAPRGAPAVDAQSPVSFSGFLRSLRERSRDGDEVATSVLNQVLEVMARIDAPRAKGDDAPVAASPDSVGVTAGSEQTEPLQRRLSISDRTE
jgi:hypothetical protein